MFNLYDLKGNLLGEYTTDNRGIIEFPKEVQAGKYKLKELKAPDGPVGKVILGRGDLLDAVNAYGQLLGDSKPSGIGGDAVSTTSSPPTQSG